MKWMLLQEHKFIELRDLREKLLPQLVITTSIKSLTLRDKKLETKI